MEPEAFRIKQEEFRKFERFCLEYDIAIDEEDYLHGWEKNIGQWPLKEQLTSNKPNKEINMIYDFNFLDDKVGELCTKLDINPTSDWDEKHAMKRLIMAKRARAVLQEKNSTEALDSLDYLALYLLKHIPELETYGLLDKETWSEKTFKFLLHIMYLNEISSCYRGYASIGYSDQCLNLIKETLGKNKTPYELIAIYNKGQGYFHSNSNFEKAYSEFEKVYTPSEEQKDPLKDYFVKDRNDLFRFTVSEKHSINDKLLFQRIACIPAQRMMAECLLKLQRSEEAERIIKRYREDNSLSDYQRCWNTILEIRCKIDQEEIDDNIDTQLDSLDKEIKDLEKDKIRRPDLKNQLLTAKTEVWQIKAQIKMRQVLKNIGDSSTHNGKNNQLKLKKDIKLIQKLILHQYTCLKTMLKIQKKNLNKNEITQTIQLWTKSLNVIKEWCKLVKVLPYDDDLIHRLLKIDEIEIFHIEILEVLSDTRFRTNREEIRDNYLECLQELEEILAEIYNKVKDTKIEAIIRYLQKKEKEAIDSILNNEKMNKVTQWLKNKLQQRKRLINNELLFPKVALQVRRFLATQVFFPTKTCKIKSPRCLKYKCWDCSKLLQKSKNDPECTNRNDEIMHYYDNIASENRDKIRSILHEKKKQSIEKGVGLAILRRWNSYTPALARSEGGGYFLYSTEENKVNYGIVIDPGYDFLRNFFAEGFGINDIHAILVSHDHPDHLDDFSAIINLKFEALKSRVDKEKDGIPQEKIIAVLSEGSYAKLKNDIKLHHSVFKDTIVIPTNKDKEIFTELGLGKYFSVKATRALHQGIGKDDSIGFIITSMNEKEVKIGFTGDTKWYDGIIDTFKECKVVCYHAGAITDEKISLYKCFNENEFNKFLSRTKHLYLPGTLMFSEGCEGRDNQLLIISEFGEELKGGLRMDFVKRLADYIGKKYGRGKSAPIIPSDTGLMVRVDTQEIMCTCCKKFYRYEFIEFESFGPNERLFSICSNCKKMLSENQRQHIYRKKVMEAYTHEAELYI